MEENQLSPIDMERSQSSSKTKVPALKLDSLTNNNITKTSFLTEQTILNSPTISCSMNDPQFINQSYSPKQNRRLSDPHKPSRVTHNPMINSDKSEYKSKIINTPSNSPSPRTKAADKRRSFIKTHHSPRNISSTLITIPSSISLPNSRPTTPRKSTALSPRKLFSKESHKGNKIVVCGILQENLAPFLIKQSNIHPSTQNQIKRYGLNALQVVIADAISNNKMKDIFTDISTGDCFKNTLVFLYVNQYMLNLLSVIPIKNFTAEDADPAHLCNNYLIGYVNTYCNKEIKWPKEPRSLQDQFEQLFEYNKNMKPGHRAPFIANIVTQFLLKQLKNDNELKNLLKNQYEKQSVEKEIKNAIGVFERLQQ